MASRFVTDTSWLYALFDAKDTHHGRALAQADEAGSYVVPSEVLAEVLALRHARIRQAGIPSKPELRRLAASILDAGFQVQGSRETARALALFQRATALSYVDCVAVAEAGQDRLLTFDERQRRAWQRSRS